MFTQIRKGAVGLFVFACFIGLGSRGVWAEENSTVPAKPLSPEEVQARIAKWKQLKEQNPEEFKRLIQERKEHLKTRLKELKEKDPQKYEEVRKRMYQHRVKYLRRLRNENPEKYREIVERRWQKLGELKTKNPERFKEFMEKHPRVAQRWEYRQQHGLKPGQGSARPKGLGKAGKGGRGFFGKDRR